MDAAACLPANFLQICFTFLARFGSIFSRFWTAYRKNEIETHKSKTRGSTCVSSLFPCVCCLLRVIIVPFFLSSLFNFCQGYIDMSWNDSFATSLFVKTSVNRGFVVWRHWHPPSQVCSLGQVKPTWNEQPVWEGVQNLCDSERKHGSSVKPISQKIWFFFVIFEPWASWCEEFLEGQPLRSAVGVPKAMNHISTRQCCNCTAQDDLCCLPFSFNRCDGSNVTRWRVLAPWLGPWDKNVVDNFFCV